MDTGRKAIEKRQQPRKPCNALVDLLHPAMGTVQMQLVNLSEGGVLLQTGNAALPPVGALVAVHFPQELGFGSDALDMLVVHKRRGFIGLRFL